MCELMRYGRPICCGADEPAAAAPVRNVTMSVEQEAYTVREAVGVFNHPEDMPSESSKSIRQTVPTFIHCQ